MTAQSAVIGCSRLRRQSSLSNVDTTSTELVTTNICRHLISARYVIEAQSTWSCNGGSWIDTLKCSQCQVNSLTQKYGLVVTIVLQGAAQAITGWVINAQYVEVTTQMKSRLWIAQQIKKHKQWKELNESEWQHKLWRVNSTQVPGHQSQWQLLHQQKQEQEHLQYLRHLNNTTLDDLIIILQGQTIRHSSVATYTNRQTSSHLTTFMHLHLQQHHHTHLHEVVDLLYPQATKPHKQIETLSALEAPPITFTQAGLRHLHSLRMRTTPVSGVNASARHFPLFRSIGRCAASRCRRCPQWPCQVFPQATCQICRICQHCQTCRVYLRCQLCEAWACQVCLRGTCRVCKCRCRACLMYVG